MTELLSPPWIAAGVAALACLGLMVWMAASADAAKRARFREALAGLVQYGLLFGFADVAAAISAHGLIGFAKANMELRGPWPVLLWGALDGAAGLCAVLLMRRAARGESALAPRLAVWGLVAASSAFNGCRIGPITSPCGRISSRPKVRPRSAAPTPGRPKRTSFSGAASGR